MFIVAVMWVESKLLKLFKQTQKSSKEKLLDDVFRILRFQNWINTDMKMLNQVLNAQVGTI